MKELLQLAGLLVIGAGLSDLFAHRDELTARRFRELNPNVVQSDLDRSRNKRWHGAGLRLRATVAGLLAVAVGLSLRSVVAGALAALILGFSVALWFDVFFNLRFGQKWDYTGDTAETDKVTSGKKAAALEAAGLALASAAWLWLA